MMAEINVRPIDELAEIAQKYYNVYSIRVNSHEQYHNVPTEARDELLDFFEKNCMISLYT